MRALPFRSIAHAALLLLLAACATDGPALVAPPPEDGVLTRETGVQLVLASGDGQTGMVGHALPEPVVVRVLDQAGRPVADARVNFLPPRDGAVDPRQARTDAEGYARATWTPGSLGEQTLRVSGTGGTLLVTATAQAGSGAGIMLLRTGGDGQTGAPGTRLRGGLQLRVLRDDGTPVQGAVLAWAVTSGGGSLDAAVSRSSANGYSVRRWTLGPDAGAQSVTVSTPGAEPVTFTAGAHGFSLTKTVGDGQAGEAATLLRRPLQVRAMRPDGTPAAGATVTWMVTSGGGSLDRTSSRASVNGYTYVRWTLGPDGGTQTVTASAPGTDSVVFTATAPQRPGARPAVLDVAPDSLVLEVGASGALAAVVRGPDGAELPGHTPVWSSSDSTVAAVDARGTVRGVAAGTARITASLGALSASATVRVRGRGPSLELFPDSLVLDIGVWGKLYPVARDASGRATLDYRVEYSTSSDQVVFPMADGSLLPIRAGTALVTARWGDLSASVRVRVRPPAGALTIPQIQKRVISTGGSIDPSDRNVDLSWTIHVSQRNVSAVTMRIRGPAGRTIDCRDVDATHFTRHEFRCWLQIPRGAEPGTWRVDRVTVTREGQTTVFTSDDLEAMGTLGRAFAVLGTGADTEPPRVAMLWPHQGTRHPDVYYLQAGVTDVVSGVNRVRMTVRGPGGVTHSCDLSQSYGALSRTGGGVCRLPLRPGSGTWDLVSVEVEDGAGNRATYTPEQIARLASGMSEAPFLVYSFTP